MHIKPLTFFQIGRPPESPNIQVRLVDEIHIGSYHYAALRAEPFLWR